MPNPLGVALRNKRVGYEKLVWVRPDLQAPETFSLTSPAFSDGNPIPEEYGGRIFGRNSSPALAWTAPPEAAAELVLIVEDADSPFGNPNTHGLAAGIDPALGSIPADGLTGAGPAGDPARGAGDGLGGGFVLGKTGPHQGWFGPMPIPSHGPHRYVFQIFALGRRLELPAKFKLSDALAVMGGHVIGRARLEGIYEKR